MKEVTISDFKANCFSLLNQVQKTKRPLRVTRFGKPILERSLTHSDPILYAFKLGVLAFDATRLCASNVDFPIDLVLYRRGSYELVEHRYERADLNQISSWWQERMRCAVDELPSKWVEAAFSKLGGSGEPPGKS